MLSWTRFRVAVASLLGALLFLGFLPAATSPAAGAPGGTNPNQTVVPGLTATALAQSLVGPGVTVSNAVFTGSPQAEGTFSFADPNVVGFNQGIILGSGNVVEVVGPNASDSNSGVMSSGSDPDLDTLAGFPTFDAAVLQFDFVPTANQVTFTYVFASDEYSEWAHTAFNDVFAFFVNGDNCATVRQVAGDPTAPFVPVAVNNINQGNPVGDPTPARPDLFRPNSYNPGGPSVLDVELDGLTTDLICQHAVTPGATNHLKLAIADASDEVWDSAVFIQAGSLVSNENPTADLGIDPDSGPAPLVVTASIEGEDPNGLPLTYVLDWGDGTPAATGSLPDATTLEQHTYANGGHFVPTLTVSNGSLTGQDTEDVHVSGGSPSAPFVTDHPTAQSVVEGETFVFSAHANGNPAPDVQWQVSTDGTNFTDIPGAVFDTYTDTAALGDDGNQYQAVFTNSEGSATTDPAVLTVTAAPDSAPTVTSDPEDQSVIAGEAFSFTSTAEGTPSPTVQWQLSTDGGDVFTDIPDATDTTYGGIATVADNGNQYRAVFTNTGGSATSGDAMLTVAPAAVAPDVTAHPGPQSVLNGEKFTFSAAATGNPTPSVQWKVSTDGGTSFTDIPGATDTTYGGIATMAANGNLYEAVFTNSAGSATTSAATLTVLDVTAPSLSVWLTPAAPYLRNQTGVTVNHAASDDSGEVTVECGTVDTSTAGSKSVLCTATDPSGNATPVSTAYVVGFQVTVTSPAPGSSYSQKTAIPVSFTVADANGLLDDASAGTLRPSIRVRFDLDAWETPRYSKPANAFSVSLKTGRPAPGAHAVTVEIVVGGVVVNQVVIAVTIV